MARYSVALAAVLMHTLIGIVCAMPGMPGPPGSASGPGLSGRTIQCPSCGRHFKTHRAVRQHQAHMGKTSKCYTDLRPPIPIWLGRRRRARGRTGGEPQSRRPAARYDGLGHGLKRSTQSAPDGRGSTAFAGSGLGLGLGRQPRAC